MKIEIALYICTFLCLISILVNFLIIKKFSVALSARKREEHRRELKLFKLYESLEGMIEEFEHFIFAEQKNYIVNRKNRNKLNLVFDDRVRDENKSFSSETTDDEVPDADFKIEEENFSCDDNIKSEFIIDNIIDGTKIMSEGKSEKVDFEIQNISHIEEQFEIPQEIDETVLGNTENVVKDDNFNCKSDNDSSVTNTSLTEDSAPVTNEETVMSYNSGTESDGVKHRGTNDEIKKMLREGQKVTVIAEILGRSVAEVVLIKEMMDRN